MQLVQTTRDALLKPLSTVAGIVERRHTLPILANILMRKEGNKVAFIATDLEVQITTHADFGVGQDNESTTVAARKLLDILKALPDTGEVKLALASNKLSVQSAKSRFALQTLAASEFPTVAQPEQWDVSLTLPQRTLRHLFNMVHFAMAQQDIRYYLNGMLLVFEPGRVRAVATDGHRLAHCSTEADGIRNATKSSCRARPCWKCSACWKTPTSPSPSTWRRARSVSVSATSSWCPSWSKASSPISRA